MTPSQWIQVALTGAAILIAAVVLREAVRQLRLEVDKLTPKVEATEKLQSKELGEVNLKLAKLEHLPAGLSGVSAKLGELERTVAQQTPRLEAIRRVEKRLERVEDTQQEIRVRLAEKGIRTRTPPSGTPITLAPPLKRESDEGGNT
jgi:DNA repair exonuclease SbcCD ATPase subunit